VKKKKKTMGSIESVSGGLGRNASRDGGGSGPH
jgi:hypothetical protein